MNSPLPIQQFMVWKVPSREIGAVPFPEGLELPPEYITRNEGQYNCMIVLRHSITCHFLIIDFDAIDELGGNLGGLMLPPAQASSTDYGAYLHKNPGFKHLQQRNEPRLKPVSKDVSAGESYHDLLLHNLFYAVAGTCFNARPREAIRT